MKNIITFLTLFFFATTMFAQKNMLLDLRQPKIVNEHFDRQHHENDRMQKQFLEREQELKLLQIHEKKSTKTTYTGAANETDSLAIVALYNATDGINWINKDNWLTGNVTDWHGISLDENGRVSKIDLEYNQLTGIIPAEIGNLSNLENLNFDYNQITGIIPTEIGNLTNLRSLELSENKLTGSIPAEIGSLTNLVSLDLRWNQLTGSILKEIANLYVLQLGGNQLTGSIPAEIGNLNNLEWLDLASNQLTGNIPTEIGNLTNLKSLKLYNNQLTGSIPVEISNLSNLQYFYLYNNQFTGSIPTQICNLTNLLYLELNENQLTGSIPKKIGNLTKLNSLKLNNNQLTGSIPVEIGNLSNLQHLNLSDNQLIGSIPTKIANLYVLKLGSNQLTGSIPAEIGNLSNLEGLDLASNQLTGSIPTEIGNLTNLTELLVSNNQFTDLPNLNTLTSMSRWEVTNNQFTFEDIEPNINVGNTFSYSPQAKVGDVEHYTPNTGDNLNLTVTVGGSANTYQWFKDDVEISGAVNDTYTITNYSASDNAVYMCKISNTIATNLILESRNKYVGIDVQTFDISATTNPTEGGTVSGAETYNDGATATLTATANTAYAFANWTEGGTVVSVDASYSFLATQNSAFIANFISTVGISDFNKTGSLLIYPNPNTGSFALIFDNSYKGELNIKIYSATGAIMKALKVNKSTDKMTYSIDLGSVAGGTYFMCITSTKEKITKTIVIE